MLAVRGPRGDGLTKAQIIATFERRLEHHPDFEFAEALRNVHRVAELRLDDRFAAAADARPAGLGLRRAAGAPLRSGLRRERPAHRHLPDRRASRLRRADRALDARVRLRRREDRCGRQRRRRLPRRQRRREDAPHRIALRHGEERRQVRRPARHLRADGRGARAEPRRPAPAVRARAGRLRRGGRPALQGDLPRLGRAGRPVRRALARRSTTPTA